MKYNRSSVKPICEKQPYVKISKRSMHRTPFKQVCYKITDYNSRNYATIVAIKLKNKAAKNLANDANGKHSHVGTQTCTLQDCQTKECPTLCSQPDKLCIDGHNTHKPPIGRFARFIYEKDANGNNIPQYYVKMNKKTECTEEEKQTKYANDIKKDEKTESFVKQHSDKYNDE